MEDVININEYIRTKGGCIFKVTEYWLGECYSDRVNIKKHSPNIIDLIGEGDYVNGKEVKHIAWFEGVPDYPKLIFADEHRLIPGETAENDEIKSVVTKEQFNQMKYIVGDE